MLYLNPNRQQQLKAAKQQKLDELREEKLRLRQEKERMRLAEEHARLQKMRNALRLEEDFRLSRLRGRGKASASPSTNLTTSPGLNLVEYRSIGLQSEVYTTEDKCIATSNLREAHQAKAKNITTQVDEYASFYHDSELEDDTGKSPNSFVINQQGLAVHLLDKYPARSKSIAKQSKGGNIIIRRTSEKVVGHQPFMPQRHLFRHVSPEPRQVQHSERLERMKDYYQNVVKAEHRPIPNINNSLMASKKRLQFSSRRLSTIKKVCLSNLALQ